jgi:phenylalanyl-tRNA synthetase alpha subunit
MENEISIIPPAEIISVEVDFGVYIIRSTLCDICMCQDHMRINSARGQKYKSYKEIGEEFGFSKELVEKHFKKHFAVNSKAQKLINLTESSSPEAHEIVTQILEKNLDFVDGSSAVLQSKTRRLSLVWNRLKEIYEIQEDKDLEIVETQEYLQLHKLANDIEDSITKTLKEIDKKIINSKGEGISNAIMQYKLNILSRLLDNIQLIFFKFERQSPIYAELISNIRKELAKEFNKLEDEILKAGGIFNSND